ncbi:MAG: DUF1573 domain-containing protein [Bacteroidia bacterium]|nr:DUF1573 domain-containing protein [Bacteroidia bacterium]MDW8058139.1 DUF1573 domain-containing protein [Bacteroidia bacterium]
MIFDEKNRMMIARGIILGVLTIGWAQAPRLRVQPAEGTFGRVSQGTVVKARFVLINEGTAPLQIQDIKPSCSCSVLAWERRSISPGDSAAVEVSFNTAGKVGRQRKSFSVLSNAENSPTFFYLSGEVAAGSLYED